MLAEAREQAQELFGTLETDDAYALDLVATGIEEEDSRRNVEAETLQ